MRRLRERLGFPIWLPLLLGVLLFWVVQHMAAAPHHARHRVPLHTASYRLLNV